MKLYQPTRRNKSRALVEYESLSFIRIWLMLFCIIVTTPGSTTLSQEVAKTTANSIQIYGTVLGVDSKPVNNAKILLKAEKVTGLQEKRLSTGTDGQFTFTDLQIGTYSLTAEKLGEVSDTITLQLTTSRKVSEVNLVLKQPTPSTKAPATSGSSLGAMQFADQPNFTVAGVTDFTAVGGHGSDATLRTSEALAVEASNLKPEGRGSSAALEPSTESEDRLKAAVLKAPESFDANHQLGELYFHEGNYSEAILLFQNAYRIDKNNYENEYHLALACKALGDPAHSRKYVAELLTHQESGELYRLAADLDESLGDSLASVKEFQKAASLDPSEQNFFAWGSELLLHRAIWQAQQVFEQGAKQYPASSRMLTGLGTALFSGAAYEQAAANLCKASDLKPSDPEPYIFLGKIQMAAPNQLGCIEERLQRFVRGQPGSAPANYLYAMAIQKREDCTANPESRKHLEALLRTAVAIDPNYSEAWLQLGILYASQRNFTRAIESYQKAITANPKLSDAYYRLAVAYDRSGQAAKAREEFSLHEEVAKQQAIETERQRQEIKQFLVVLPPEPVHAETR